MHVMTKTDAERHGLFTIDPVTGKPVPFSTWRIELTDEQRAEQEKMIASGQIPF